MGGIVKRLWSLSLLVGLVASCITPAAVQPTPQVIVKTVEVPGVQPTPLVVSTVPSVCLIALDDLTAALYASNALLSAYMVPREPTVPEVVAFTGLDPTAMFGRVTACKASAGMVP